MHIGFDVAQTCGQKAGCGWYADALIRAMVKIAPQDTFSLYHHFGWWHNETTKDGTKVVAPNATHPFVDWSRDRSVSQWARYRTGSPLPGRPEIVHSTSFQAPPLRGTKLVFTVFDISFWILPEFTTEQNRIACQTGTLAALEHAAGFIFISQSALNEFERVLPGWLAATNTPFAVTPLAASPSVETSFVPTHDQTDYWLAVGSLEPRKNYEGLLDAFELYWERSVVPKPLLIAGGHGWKSDRLRERIHSLSERKMVEYLGYVPDAKIKDLYTNAFGLIFPSWYEGFGLPVLEAMALGCPVISSDRTSLMEVGGDAVLYIDPSRPEQIADAMLKLESNLSLRFAQRELGAGQAAKFDWDKTAKLTFELYKKVLDGGTS
jgi:glycosyltransferase involved in cell wall biosynthesis